MLIALKDISHKEQLDTLLFYLEDGTDLMEIYNI